jgi:serine/threonine-protein kinase
MTALPARFGSFVLESRLAVGGTSEVFVARAADDRTGELPARFLVKRPLQQFNNDAAWRAVFEREARLQALVSHANVVRIFQAGALETGEPYLVTELVEGVDGERLIRRARQDQERFDPALAAFIAHQTLDALQAVHAAKDDTGQLIGLMHRDVSPSNIYLSRAGEVKLGDFGLANARERAPRGGGDTGRALKGKFAYLAPEQVAGEAVDHRADLFSLGVVLAEFLLGRPLFEGSGQLAILLAIRDGRIEALQDLKDRVPPGLLEVLRRALARAPRDRFDNAAAFRDALAPFAMSDHLATQSLAKKVTWVLTNPSRAIPVVRVHSTPHRNEADPRAEALALEETGISTKAMLADPHKTATYSVVPSFVKLASGDTLGPLSFAALAEALATGVIARGDEVSYAGAPYAPVEELPDLERLLPSVTASTTRDLEAPSPPTVNAALTVESVLRICARIVANKETGVLFAERPASVRDPKGSRKELYFEDGQLQHVASSNSAELLGEYLVRRGEISRDELDVALAVLPRYDGRIGDTLIALGLVTGFNVFRAIREQGRDRVADLFRWGEGTLTYYQGERRPRVEFPLRLEVTQLMLAGLETVSPQDSPIATYRARLDRELAPAGKPIDDLPARLDVVLGLVPTQRPLRQVLKDATDRALASNGDVLRCIEVLVALGQLRWVP